MSDESPNSSSVLLTVDDKGSPTRNSQYTSIAPKAPGTAAALPSGLALSPIAPSAESRADGTPMLGGGSPSASSERRASSSSRGGNGEGSGNAAGKRRTTESASEAGKRKATEGVPETGSEEWLRLRRLAHKEVEQRRRDVINTGIDRLAELVPGAERHRGRIVNQAVDYIHRLKEAEAQNIEKWTIEKLLADQVISGLTNQLEQMKQENKRLKRKIKAVADGAQLADSPAEDDDNMDQDDEQDESNVVSSELPIVDESMASEAAAAASSAAAAGAASEEADADATSPGSSRHKSKSGKRRKR
ncbi:basic helix-loop-helix protein [Coemansia sp. RSA 1836]|nr:basic helix-loop-helix protein [Coemansia sp. RSA 1836]